MGVEKMTVNILATLNSNYLKPLKIMLKSLFFNNRKLDFAIYVMHSSLTEDEIRDLRRYVEGKGHQLHSIRIGSDVFHDAPVLPHYTKEMYYRLLAFKFLPEEMERILYLDPDILVINSVEELYKMDLDGYLYAAAYHDLPPVKEINKIRLNQYEMDAYYNSGVLLMNLELQRRLIDEREIFDFVRENRAKLIMPDQDIMNALYSKRIKTLDEVIYNYDVRYYSLYKLRSGGEYDMDFIFKNTVFLHFCGKKKPWRKNYSGRFHSVYKHYEYLDY